MATQADIRCQVVRQVAESLAYSNFLLGKVVTQRIEEYENLIEYSNINRLSVWVNCKSRAYPFHQRTRRFLNPAEPVTFTVVGGNHGLATNGVHAAGEATADGMAVLERMCDAYEERYLNQGPPIARVSIGDFTI